MGFERALLKPEVQSKLHLAHRRRRIGNLAGA
jgi:hypothetical protein